MYLIWISEFLVKKKIKINQSKKDRGEKKGEKKTDMREKYNAETDVK